MTAIHALLGFTAWTLLLVAIVLAYRTARLLRGSAINAWPRGEKNAADAGFMKRVEDAHANCLENLLPFAAIVLSAAALGKLDAINALAPWVLYARLGQTAAHLAGSGQAHVLVRVSFWSAQLLLFFWMLARVFG